MYFESNARFVGTVFRVRCSQDKTWEPFFSGSPPANFFKPLTQYGASVLFARQTAYRARIRCCNVEWQRQFRLAVKRFSGSEPDYRPELLVDALDIMTNILERPALSGNSLVG